MGTRQASKEGLDHARAARRHTSRIRKSGTSIEVESYFRRHELRQANDGGVTYSVLAEMTHSSETVVAEQIAKARKELDKGLWPPVGGEPPAEVLTSA